MKHHLDQNHRFEIKQIIPLILRAVLFPFLLAFENGSTPNKFKKKYFLIPLYVKMKIKIIILV